MANKINIIIVTYNSGKTIKNCLDSIIKTSKSCDKITVVDNNSKDNTIQILNNFPITRINNKTNLGFSRAVNQGFDKNYNFTLLLNPDTIVFNGWRKNLILEFKKGNVGAVGPISNWAGGKQNAYHFIKENEKINFKNAAKKNKYKFFEKFANDILSSKKTSINTKLLTGFCLLISTSVFEKINLLDEKLFLGMDDLDLSWRLRLHNYTLKISTNTFVYHNGQVSFKTRPAEEIKKINKHCVEILNDKLINHYGFNNVPTPNELWEINWFNPINHSFNRDSKLHDKKPYHINENHLNNLKTKQYEKVSIIMLTFNALKYTKLCIESIFSNTLYPFELIIVDNNSNDGTQKYLINLEEKHKNVKIKLNKKNFGFSKGNNQGVQLASSKYIMILNNDTLVPEGWLSKMISSIEKDKMIGIIGPVSNSISGLQQIKVPYIDDTQFFDFAKSKILQNDGPLSPRRRLAGFCLLMKRDLYNNVGGFSEDFHIGNFEDDDLSLRVREKGYALMCDESVLIHHYGSASFSLDIKNFNESMTINSRIFKKKWPNVDYEQLIEQKSRLSDYENKIIKESFKLFESSKYSKSNNFVNEILTFNPISKYSLYLKSLILHNLGNFQKSEEIIDRLLYLYPRFSDGYLQKGILKLEVNDFKNSIKYFQQSIDFEPTNVLPYKLRSEALVLNGQTNSAIDSLTEIFNIFPNEFDSMERLANIYFENDMKEDAFKILDLIKSKDINNSYAKKMLGLNK